MDILKMIAFIAMTLDHIAVMEIVNEDSLRIIGRLACPIFCLLAGNGAVKTRDRNAYIKRLFAIAVISQILHIYSIGYQVNILFSLCMGVLLFHATRENSSNFINVNLLLFHLVAFPFVSYGLMAVMLTYNAARMSILWCFVSIMLLNFNIYKLDEQNLYYILFSFLGMGAYLLLRNYDFKIDVMKSRLLYLYYPLHLGLLILLR